MRKKRKRMKNRAFRLVVFKDGQQYFKGIIENKKRAFTAYNLYAQDTTQLFIARLTDSTGRLLAESR
jgi:hypothetical protein